MKFQPFRLSWRYWVAGLLAAILGVCIARGLAPRLEGKAQTVVAGVGRLTAAAGLLIIAVGVSRRVEAENKEES